ncbi:MAG TPA: hypothetical protein VEW69_06360 [Alphaproteobacteria bacterium]|nr:hypothetical protein [Alphaproteobacteria bacterium]
MWEAHELLEYWQEYPPTHVLVAAYVLRGQQRGKKRSGGKPQAEHDELMQMVGSAGGGVRGRLPEIYRSDKTSKSES